MKYLSLILISFAFIIKSFGQQNLPDVKIEVRISADSDAIVSSFRGFLAQTAKPAYQNEYILREDLPATAAFLDEVKGMAVSRERDVVYKCHINNFLNIDSTQSLIQFSYQAAERPGVRALFNILTKKTNGRYYFYTVLRRNTSTWKFYKSGSFNFYYENELDKNKAKFYANKASLYDKKLNAKAYTTEFYACNDLPKAFQILGISYNADYKGVTYSSLSALQNDISLYLYGVSKGQPEYFYTHDLWHYRLHNVVSVDLINRPVDEGCAYLFGGSWGVSRDDIFKLFKEFIGTDKDYFKAFNENKNFGNDARKPMYVSYMINALIVKQLEAEKGFPAVIELLTCGKRQKDNANYFAALNKLTGINSSNFNTRIRDLVDKGFER